MTLPQGIHHSPLGGKLILGGHSFIAQLGSDPEASEIEQQQIVRACIASGITAIDTTYSPERIGLARALASCSPEVRSAARPIIWNFFGPLTEPLPGPLPWTEERFEQAVSELLPWQGRPIVVVHTVNDDESNRKQIATARALKQAGCIALLGVWTASSASWEGDAAHPWDFFVHPWNPTCADKERPLFRSAREHRLTTVGTSPFVRGWELDRLTKRETERSDLSPAEARIRVADALLRFTAFAPEVDHVIVGMRSAHYVATNLASLDRGRLDEHEIRFI